MYLTKSKCVFGKTKIPFLGHWVGQGCIHMDPKKIEAIMVREGVEKST